MIEEEFISIESYNKNQNIFRYIEIEKLILLLTENAFPLSRMTLFNDPYEGSSPKRFIEIEKQRMKTFIGDKKPKDYRENKDAFVKNSMNLEYNWRKNYFISCWHANNYESEAMWRLYSNYHKGIAIQTDLNTLINEFPNEYDNKEYKSKIRVAEIKYIDFNNPDQSLYKPVFVETSLLKRKAFDFEKEIRVFTHLGCGWGNEKKGIEPEIEEDYILLDVDLKNIIKEIIIAPDSPEWYRKIILSIINKYDFHFDVESSSLTEKPIHRFWGHAGIIDED